MDFDSTSPQSNSRERRDQIKKEIDKLAQGLPFKFEKLSQLRILKAICTYLKKEKHFSDLKYLAQSNAKRFGFMSNNFYDSNLSFFNDIYSNEVKKNKIKLKCEIF